MTQVAHELSTRLDALAERVVDRVWENVPGYQPPRMRRVDLAESVAPNLRSVLTRLTGGPDEQAGERARRIGAARALQGVPLDAVVLSYRTAERVLTDAFVADARGLDVDELREGLHRLAEGFDELATASIESYRETQREVTTHYDRVAGDLVAGLVGGDLDAQQVRRLARLLGTDPDGSWQAIALAATGAELAVSLSLQRDVLAMLGRGRAGRILAGAVRGCEVLLVPGMISIDDVRNLERVVRAHPDAATRVTVGDQAPGLADAGTSCRQALVAMDVATKRRPIGSVTPYSSVLLDVLANADQDAAGALVQRYLEPIRDLPHLTETLEALADGDLSIRAAASKLYVHPNTVAYRIGRIRELTGFDPRHARELIAFIMALRAEPR